jgi:hypothetical protein
MLRELKKEIVEQYVNEYIDGLRMDVIVLARNRVISAQSAPRIGQAFLYQALYEGFQFSDIAMAHGAGA